MGIMRCFLKTMHAVASRELLLAGRRGASLFMALGFFVICASLFPFALGPYPALLKTAGPGALWISVLLSVLLTLDGVWQPDYEDGTFDILALAPAPLSAVVAGKMLAHWVLAGLPLVLVSPLLALMFNIPSGALGVLTLSLLIGSAFIILIGGVGATLTLGSRRAGVLLPILLLPFYIPVLIFGVAAVDAQVALNDASAQVLILAAMLAVALPLAPLVASACIRKALG